MGEHSLARMHCFQRFQRLVTDSVDQWCRHSNVTEELLHAALQEASQQAKLGKETWLGKDCYQGLSTCQVKILHSYIQWYKINSKNYHIQHLSRWLKTFMSFLPGAITVGYGKVKGQIFFWVFFHETQYVSTITNSETCLVRHWKSLEMLILINLQNI